MFMSYSIMLYAVFCDKRMYVYIYIHTHVIHIHIYIHTYMCLYTYIYILNIFTVLINHFYVDVKSKCLKIDLPVQMFKHKNK